MQDALDTVLGATLPRLTVKVAAGSAITITDGTSTITGTANTAGSFTTNLPRTGTWSVSATLNGESTDGSVNAASLGGNYTIELAYFAATLTVSAKAGTVVTASCNGTTYSGTAASTGKATITIKKAGTYTVTGVYSGVSSPTRFFLSSSFSTSSWRTKAPGPPSYARGLQSAAPRLRFICGSQKTKTGPNTPSVSSRNSQINTGPTLPSTSRRLS